MKWASLTVPAAIAVALLGCPASSTSAVYTPITGIAIDSASLVAGLGCGDAGPDQVFRYAVVLSFQPQGDAGVDASGGDGGIPAPGISGVFDCFADGLFSNLPTSNAGASSFVLSVFAFNATSFPSDLSCSITENMSLKGSSTGVDCPGNNPANVLRDESKADWTTTCTAPQVDGVTVFAVCNPLVATGAASDAGASPGGDAGGAGAPSNDASGVDAASTSIDSAVGD